jgi:putative salt-induced outer membrane protein
MKKILMTGLALATLATFAAQAQDTNTNSGTQTTTSDWTGSGELGFASTTGNSRSQNLNAKLNLNQETDQWKNNFFFDALRSKGQVNVVDAAGATLKQFDTTANRYDAGASIGFKLDPRSYIVTAARYDHDDFGSNIWQGTISVGYGYIALKNDRTQLSFEIGPGYTEYQPAPGTVTINGVALPSTESQQSEVVARGLVNYKYRLTDNTSFEDTFLTEAGSKNTYLQNDAGLAVSMTKKLSIKVGFQVRHNTFVLPGIRNTDTLATTNIVYNI